MKENLLLMYKRYACSSWISVKGGKASELLLRALPLFLHLP